MLRVCAAQGSHPIHSNGFLSSDSRYASILLFGVAEEYIPKKDVIHTLKFDDHNALTIMTLFGRAKDAQPEEKVQHDSILAALDAQDVCDAPDPTLGCVCLKALFPVHVIAVKNRLNQRFTSDTQSTYVPAIIMYLVHHSEREHMERFLAGTDNPMYDFVHELRLLPPDAPLLRQARGRDVREAQVRVEGERAKRQKKDVA